MTHGEAKRLAKIVATADGGCTVCVRQLVASLSIEYPSHDWAALTADDVCESVKAWREEVNHAAENIRFLREEGR